MKKTTIIIIACFPTYECGGGNRSQTILRTCAKWSRSVLVLSVKKVATC